jgi:hypothetical protein
LRAVTDPAALLSSGDLDGEGELILRAGKKRYRRVVATK